MAVAVDATMLAGNSADGFNQQATAATTINSTGITVTAAATLLVATLAWGKGSTGTAPVGLSMTWNGTAMTAGPTVSHVIGGAFATTAIFYLINPAAGANTLSASWANANDCYLSAVSLKGTDVVTGIATVDNTTITGSTTLGVTSTSDGATVAVFAVDGAAPTVNFTKIFSEAPLAPGGGANYALGGTTNSHIFLGGGGTVQSISGVHILAVGTAASAGTLTQTLPTTSTSTTGWTVGTTAAANYARMTFNTELSAGNFSTTVQPSGSPIGGAGDCFRSQDSLFGQFQAGWWTSSVSVIGVTSGGDADGRVRINIYKSVNADGSSAQTLNTATMVGNLVTNLSTSVAQSSAVSAYIDRSNFTNEYLFVQAAWEITGVGGAADRDVLIRFGSMSLANGSGLLTSEFSTLGLVPGGGVPGGGFVFRRRRTDGICAMEDL